MGIGFGISFNHGKPFVDADGKLKAEFTLTMGESKLSFVAELNPNNYELIEGEWRDKNGGEQL